jgi:hypothetical protein
MRDELNVVITFTLALKFAFIVTRRQLDFSLLSSGHSHASLRHQKIIRSCLPHMECDHIIDWCRSDTDRMVCT